MLALCGPQARGELVSRGPPRRPHSLAPRLGAPTRRRHPTGRWASAEPATGPGTARRYGSATSFHRRLTSSGTERGPAGRLVEGARRRRVPDPPVRRPEVRRGLPGVPRLVTWSPRATPARGIGTRLIGRARPAASSARRLALGVGWTTRRPRLYERSYSDWGLNRLGDLAGVDQEGHRWRRRRSSTAGNTSD